MWLDRVPGLSHACEQLMSNYTALKTNTFKVSILIITISRDNKDAKASGHMSQDYYDIKNSTKKIPLRSSTC